MYVVTACCFLHLKKKEKKKQMDSSCFALFKCVLSQEALCTVSHLRVHTYVHTIPGRHLPVRSNSGGSATAFTCAARSDSSSLLLRLGSSCASTQSLRAEEMIRLLAPACLPLASRLTFQDTARETYSMCGGREARIVMPFRVARCRPTRLCFSRVKAM